MMVPPPVSFPSLGLICLRHSLSNSSLGASFLIIPGYLLFHTGWWLWRSLGSGPPPSVQSQAARLGVKPTVHPELSCLDISGFYLLLWPGFYTSRISDDWQGIRHTRLILCRYVVVAYCLGCHLPVWSQGICSCPEHLLRCPLVVQPPSVGIALPLCDFGTSRWSGVHVES